MVKSEKMFSPAEYIAAVTGKYYIMFRDDKPVDEVVRDILNENDLSGFWDYPLSEIDHIVENKLNVVLVDCGEYNSDMAWQENYRWFEVPEDFTEEVD